jgi:hypothetical protein
LFIAYEIVQPQRSGEGSKADGTIDIAPSFNILNHSFDSFGDTQYFNIDSTLNADSFGLAQSDSLVDPEQQRAAAAAVAHPPTVLREASSGGVDNFSAPYLAPSGSGGALTIGYSPVNSFGGHNATLRRGGSGGSGGGHMMMVGGGDGRSASPTQVFGMYRSYSGGTVRPLDDSHMRMSVGSFGGNSILGYNNRSYGGVNDPASNSPTYYMGPVPSHEGSDRTPHFYILLRKFSAAFKDCTFLLPGVKSAVLEESAADGGTDGNGDETTVSPILKCRALCARIRTLMPMHSLI